LEVLEIGVLIKGIQEVQNSLETKLVLILKENRVKLTNWKENKKNLDEMGLVLLERVRKFDSHRNISTLLYSLLLSGAN
jgi:hypothetical protein